MLSHGSHDISLNILAIATDFCVIVWGDDAKVRGEREFRGFLLRIRLASDNSGGSGSPTRP